MKHYCSSPKTLLLLLAASLIFPAALHAQKKNNLGTEFYIAFGQNLGGHDIESDEDSNFFALFISSRVPTSGTVEVAALNWSRSCTSTPGKITTIELPDGKFAGDPSVECKVSEVVLPGMAVHITS